MNLLYYCKTQILEPKDVSANTIANTYFDMLSQALTTTAMGEQHNQCGAIFFSQRKGQ
jgi:hypothetical protein